MIYLGSHAIGLNTLLSPHIVITTPAGIATFKTSVSTPLVAGKVEFGPIQAGSGDPSPTNVRPITGWTGLTVWRTGKNLLTVSNIIENKTIVDSQDGEPINTIDSSASNIIRNACWVKSGVTYKLSYTVSGTPGSSNARSACITKDGVNVIQALRIQSFSTGNHAQNIIPSTDGYLWIAVDKATTDIQFELGSSESTYEPYSGTSYPVTFPAEAGTVYGGTVDLVSGVLEVDRVKVTLDGSSYWGNPTTTGGVCRYARATNPPVKSGTTSKLICSYFKSSAEAVAWNAFIGSSNTNLLIFVPNTISTSDDLKAYLTENPLEVCYELATPTYIQLDPLTVQTLIGTNNIYSDANGNITISYWKN